MLPTLRARGDRKSTRLNSSHGYISYAVFCLKKKNRVIYVGDGSSDIHVMLHVNRLNGLTIAVSENKYLAQIAKRTVLSDDALSVLVPIFEEIVGMDAGGIHALFEARGLVLQEWDKVQTDLLTIRETDAAPPLVA